jgi:hypothetical protein
MPPIAPAVPAARSSPSTPGCPLLPTNPAPPSPAANPAAGDFEGVNTLSSPDNQFSVAALDLVGRFSVLAKADGYRVSLVPPESYWDVQTGAFDRSLRHNYPYPDGWNTDFMYHGRNAYAYIFSRYNNATNMWGVPVFDWVTVQIYESFAHALYNTTVGGQSASDYLTRYVPQLVAGWDVDFSSDPALSWPSQRVTLNRTQAVIGLANGWADGSRAILMMPEEVGAAWAALSARGSEPRGFAFWDIGDEGVVPSGGSAPLFLAAGLNAFLKVRP